MKKALLFLVVSFSYVSFLFAQTYNYTHYNIENGLASSNVYVAFQDSKNFMWLGTDGGVNRFDGRTFDTYTTQDGLADNDVLRIFEDSKGRIWFLTISGHLSYFAEGKIFNEKSDPYLTKAFTGAGFYNAFEDSKKRIWFCSYNAIVSVLDGSDIFQVKITDSYPDFGACADEDSSGIVNIFSHDKRYIFDEIEKKLIRAGTISNEKSASHMRSSDNNYYFFTDDGIYKIKKGVVTKCQSIAYPENFNLSSVNGDSLDNLYIAGRNGAVLIENTEGGKKREYKYLQNEWINSMNYDNEKNLWFMTRRNGIFILPRQYKKNKLFDSTSLISENIYSLAKDKYDRIWIGSSRGQLSYLEKEKIHLIDLPGKKFFTGIFLALESDRHGDIWGCSDAFTYKVDVSKNKDRSNFKIRIVEPGDRSLNISFNQKNEPVIAGALYTAVVTEKNDRLYWKAVEDESFYKRTFCAFYDKNDRLYISNIDGLQVRSGKELQNLSRRDSLLHCKIINMQQTPDSTLLLATDGHGLIFYKNGQIVKHLTRKNGIPSDLCRKVKVFNDKIFLCTKKGLTEFKYVNDSVYDFENYNKSNGLPTDDVRDVVVTNDYIYVGTSKGLSVLNTIKKKFQVSPPPVYIRSVVSNNKILDWHKPFELKYDNNSLTVNFTAITFSNPEDVIYEYSLGTDTGNWKTASFNSLNFPNISIGKYNFSIRARKKLSDWSQPQSFSFTIIPPFYKTWWFESMVILSIFGGLSLVAIYMYRRRMRIKFLILEKKNALNMERNRISADMHDDLGSDLSKIAVIAELIKIRDKSETEFQSDLQKISEFVTGARRKMDDIIWALNPSNDSVGNMIGYINQYCLNFFEGTNMKVDINFNPTKEDIRLNARQRRNLFLIIKEIANNALKHSSATVFHLHFETNEKELAIEVGDNGVGMNSEQRKYYSSGLNNILQRVNELNGTITLVTNQGSGLKYDIRIPLRSTI